MKDGEVFKTLGQQAQLCVIQPACSLFPVARDEGNRCAFVKQLDRCRNLAFAGIQFPCDDAGDFGDDTGIFAGHVSTSSRSFSGQS